MLKNYFITALRNIWRNKFFSIINILGLSVGIACCMLIFLYAKDEISFDRFHKKKDQIYRITSDMVNPKGEINRSGNTGMMPGPSFKDKIPEIEEYVRLESAGPDIKLGNDIFSEDALYADENFFTVFSFPLLYGNPETALKDLKSLVISEDLAIKYFGKSNAIGQIIRVKTFSKEFEPFVVSAVAKNSPQNSSIKVRMILPMKFRLAQDNESEWMNFFLNTFVVLRQGTDIKTTVSKLNSVYNTEAAAQLKKMRETYDFNDKISYDLQAFTDMHLSVDYPAQNGLSNASNPIYSYILTGIAIFVLLIACINFVNLTVARSLKRAKEIGIRKVVGSQRKQLVLQFLGESFILSSFSFLLAIFLAIMLLPFFNSVSNKALSFSYLLDTKLIAGYFLLFLMTGILAGFYPALVLSRFNPVETLYGKLRFAGKNYLSKSLVVFQFALSTFLIIATVTIFSQFSYLTNYDLGYDRTNVMRVNTGEMNKTKLDVLKNELKKLPAVQMVTAEQWGGYITVAHINNGNNQEFGYNFIDEENFPFFKIKVVKGRNFSKDFQSDSTRSLIVNETFVKVAGWKNPIGETIDFYYKKKKYAVIGVVKDFHTDPLTQKITPQVFSMDPEMKYQAVFLKLKPGSKTETLKSVETTFKKTFPSVPYKYSFLDEDLREQYNSEAKWKQVITFSAILTIFISCIGLLGLAVLSSEKRAKEIGIRKVLGASVIGIAKKLSGDFIKLVGIAACIALPGGWWVMNKWLENYPYRVELNMPMFVFVVLGVLLMALCTVSYQAIKAAIANPVKSLRTD